MVKDSTAQVNSFHTGDNILYYQYINYPSVAKNGWIDLLNKEFHDDEKEIDRLIISDKESTVIMPINDSDWDFRHFGFRIGTIYNPVVINNCGKKLAQRAVKESIAYCKGKKIKVITIRVNGDNLSLIHVLQDFGFKYFENIIWPVSDLSKTEFNRNNVSYIDYYRDRIEEIKQIAIKDQYQRGHFHCDENFDMALVNSLYGKWVQTAYDNQKRIALIRQNDKIAGYFICDIDNQLGSSLGYKYGRLQSLAIDSSFRGIGLGRLLFEGTLSMLKEEGCHFVDSGYATKNHMSARLHTTFGFFSVYEELTFHLWL